MAMVCVIDIFSTFLQRVFCENTLTKKCKSKAVEFTMWIGYLFVFNLLTYKVIHTAWGNMIVFFLSFYITIRVLYADTVRTLIATTIFMYLSGMCAELLVFYGQLLIPGQMVSDSNLYVILSKIVWFCLIKFVSLFVKMRKNTELNIGDWLEVFIVPAGSIWIMIALYVQRENEKSLFNFVAVAMVMVINIFTYYLYDKSKEVVERKIKEKLLLEQCDYYMRQNKESTEWWQELRRFRHDMKQHYILEKTLLEANDYDALKKYCNENLSIVEGRKLSARTGNFYFDSIINYKADLAERQRIKLEMSLHVPSDAQVNTEDLCICLGNLIDNAMEAVEELPDDKIIVLKVWVDKKNLFLAISNRYLQERTKKGLKYQTTKDDAKQHGLGLSIVDRVITKYNGKMEIRDENSVFEVTILLYDFIA